MPCIRSTTLCIFAGAIYLAISWLSLLAESAHRRNILYDFIVIGGTLDGAILAKRLSENPNWNVLLLEPTRRYRFVPYSVETTSNTSCEWPLQDESGVYVRGVAEDYDLWLQEGNDGWGWDDVLPYFQKSVGEAGTAYMPESYVFLNESGFDNQNFADIEKLVLSRRSKSVRIHHTAETGFCDLAYIEVKKKSERRSNFFEIRNTDLQRINFDASGRRVRSISLIYRNRMMEMFFKKELVLSAGAIDSAKLLMLSGVGIKEDLNRLNIPVVHDVPVGKNLRDHISLPLFFAMQILDVYGLPFEELANKSTEEKRGPFEDRGMLALTEFINTVRRKNKVPDIEYHYFFIKHHDFNTLRNWKRSTAHNCIQHYNLEKVLLSNNLVIIQAVVIHPKTKGSVELSRTGHFYTPSILTNNLINSEDVETLMRSIHHVEEKLETPGFGILKMLKIIHPECYTEEIDDFYWRCYIKYMTMPQLNPVGTVKMGSSRNDSCVSSHLLVHGVENLRVADASIMPHIPRSEITAASMMVAEKAADLIKQKWMFG